MSYPYSTGDQILASEYNEVVKAAGPYAADSGSNDTYAITVTPAPSSYVTGMVFHFKANTINTGAATLNVNSLGAKTIVKYKDTTLADGDILAGMFCTVIYDGTNMVLQNPAANVGNKLYLSTTPITVTATTTETTIMTFSLPANTLGTNAGVRGKMHFTFHNQDTASKTLRLKYGSTTVATVTMTPTTSTSKDFEGYIDFLLLANGATNAQQGSVVIIGNESSIEIGAGVNTNLMKGAAYGTATETSTGALNLILTWQSGANNNTDFVMKHVVVEKIS